MPRRQAAAKASSEDPGGPAGANDSCGIGWRKDAGADTRAVQADGDADTGQPGDGGSDGAGPDCDDPDGAGPDCAGPDGGTAGNAAGRPDQLTGAWPGKSVADGDRSGQPASN
jgi:hypothetical protein